MAKQPEQILEEQLVAQLQKLGAGLNCFDWTFVQSSTAVILLNFCAKNPRLRKATKR